MPLVGRLIPRDLVCRLSNHTMFGFSHSAELNSLPHVCIMPLVGHLAPRDVVFRLSDHTMLGFSHSAELNSLPMSA